MCLIGEITNELSYIIPSVHVLFSVNWNKQSDVITNLIATLELPTSH